MKTWGADAEKFIEDHIELIDHNEFEKLYDIAVQKFTPRYLCQVAEILLAADIDPTTGMDYLPENFLRNSQLTEYTIPSHIRLIKNKAFSHTQFESITIPSNVTEVEEYVLFNCSKLKKVVIEEGLKIIPSGMFSYCNKLERIYLPRSIKQLSFDAFQNSDKNRDNLTIFYAGTKDEWENIQKLDTVFMDDVSGCTVVCKDGDITL